MKHGVDFYTHFTAQVTVHFPDGKEDCQHCRYCRSYDSLKRWRCALTDEDIFQPFGFVGNECPLKSLEVEQ